jgi:hypothetical protein
MPQDVAAFGLHFDPAPADAWPAQTFEDSMKLYFNGEGIQMGYIQPAHTDGDIMSGTRRAMCCVWVTFTSASFTRSSTSLQAGASTE